jgi:hypothetical protein
MVNAEQAKSKTNNASGYFKNKEVISNKIEVYSGYLKDYKVSTKEYQQQPAVDKTKTNGHQQSPS